jgi:hypothetical protein
MKRSRLEGHRAGFTLLELLLACVFLGLVGSNVFMAMSSSTRSFKTGSSRADIEHQADQTLDRIALAIMGADKSTLYSPSEFPAAHSQLLFQRSLGYQVLSSTPILSEQESIALDPGTSEVAWRVEPGTADEKRVLWTRAARQYLAGELPNGLDDNGNGLVDERGLSFSINGDLVTIQLSLEKLLDDGTRLPYTVQTQVTCRN